MSCFSSSHEVSVVADRRRDDETMPEEARVVAFSKPFDRTVRALVGALAEQVCPADWAEDGVLLDEVARFIVDRHRAMPSHLRWGVYLGTRLFGLWPVPRRLRPFDRLDRRQRWTVIQSWRASPLAACRDLMRFYLAMTSFACYEIHGERSRSA